MSRKVLVTGLGALTPCGNNIDTYWDSLINGRSGLGMTTRFDTTNFDVKISGEVKDFDPLDHIEKKQTRRMDRFTQYAIAASNMAVEDADIDFDKLDRERIGVIIGSGVGGIESHEIQHQNFLNKGPGKISPFYIILMIPDIAPGHVSMIHGLKGPNYSITSACATGSHAIGEACKTIQYGDADVMICGGTEAAVTPMAVGGFANMKALSTFNEDPVKASRPFDLERDGFVLGEGAGIVVLEAEEVAMKRGARVYAELSGIGFTADAHHVTAPPPDGEGAVRAMRIALKKAGLTAEEIDYVNAHGTSTPFNDKTETAAMKTVFGDYAYNLSISSTKSMTGHLLGAAGGVEMIAAVKALYHDIVPPTLNYATKDPECDLNYTPNNAEKKAVGTVMSNTFGFGGHNACLIAKEYK
ncbi:MAG: beta-ketoacyl-ACP synthase II [bacterium]|nr:beta-ketoacyl-ACP synthase II [bacterium]